MGSIRYPKRGVPWGELVRAAILVVSAVALSPRPTVAAPVHVGIVLDGPSHFTENVRAAFVAEMTAYFGGTTEVDFPAQCTIAADWTPASAAAAVDQLMTRKDVSIVLALGPVGSSVLATRRATPKPAIGALVLDASLQGFPFDQGTSGVRNLNYVNVAYSALRTIVAFREMVSFRHLAILMAPGPFQVTEGLRRRGMAIADSMGFTMTFVPVTTSAAGALMAIPAETDAVYLGPTEQLSDAGLDSLISGVNARRLPSYSFVGRAEVERGVLAAYAPKDDLTRRARRVAGNIQRILAGENAGSLPVDLAVIPQLTLNMATARAIRYSPTWITLSEAELLHAEAPPVGRLWSLSGVAHEALKVDRSLRAEEREVAAGRKDVAIARGALFPQVRAQASHTVIREETAAASFGQQAERQTEGEIGFSLPVISDRKWSDLSIERHQQAAREADRRGTELEAVYDATKAFLDVLRTKAIAVVERENVKNSRTNLELARLREFTGAASRADVYRWEAELANGRRRVLDAEANVALASLQFNRLLDRPLEEAFQTEDATLSDPTLVTSDPRILSYFATPATFQVFRDFMVQEGRSRSHDLQSIDAAIAAQRRAGTAARRSLWLPDVSLDGAVSDILGRSGAGSTTAGPLLPVEAPDATWSVRLQGTLPLFDGAIRIATIGRTNLELERLRIERDAADLAVSSSIRGAMQGAAASWFGIEQARRAAVASRSNLELVTDAYSRGATSIITLLDAQQAALSAEESAANAVYDFLIDLMGVERAAGRYGFFLEGPERDAFFQRMDDFYRAAGVLPSAR